MKKPMLLLIVIFLNLCGTSMSENIAAREGLLEKYKNVALAKGVYPYLENILKPDLLSEKGLNRFYDSLDKLAKSNNPFSVKMLIDLLDFYVGEASSEIIDEAIIEKGKTALPLLREKLISPVVLGELPNEMNADNVLKDRSDRIVPLMEYIYFNVPSAIEYDDLNASQMTEIKLFKVQKSLQKYDCEKDEYPNTLAELVPSDPLPNFLTRDGWNRPFRYLSGGSFYFLCSNGADGLPDTPDDIYPPMSPELHKFPPENKNK